MRHLLWWLATLAAVAAPLSLVNTVGLPETWEAFNRYQAALLSFPDRHQLRMPQPGDAVRSYRALDEDLVRWHIDMAAVYSQCTSMAVVGQVSDGDAGLEFEFDRPSGSETRALKQEFYLPRDLSLLAYLALSCLAYTSRSVPLALLVLSLNLANLAICARLKGLSDALTKSVEQLQDAQQAFLLLPLEGDALALQQQGVLLQKLRAMSEVWQGTRFGFSLTVPFLGSLSVSVAVMASLAAATSVRCSHRILRGLLPELYGLFIRRDDRQQQQQQQGWSSTPAARPQDGQKQD